VPQRERPDEKHPQPELGWLTLGQAARYLGVAQSTMRKWADSNVVEVFTTPGGHRRFRRGDLDAFLERSRPQADEQRGPRILVVDDEPGIRAYVRASLEPEGYAVEEAASSEEGLVLLEARSPDMLMIDVVMPQMDGWEMLRRVRDRYGEGTLPVLMFSAVQDGTEQLARAHGADGFIGKPLDPRKLLDRVRRALPL